MSYKEIFAVFISSIWCLFKKRVKICLFCCEFADRFDFRSVDLHTDSPSGVCGRKDCKPSFFRFWHL